MFWALYNGYLSGKTGQSVGKRMAGTRLVDAETGEVIGGSDGLMRQVLHFIDFAFLGLGFLLPLFNDSKQTIADQIKGTVVVMA